MHGYTNYDVINPTSSPSLSWATKQIWINARCPQKRLEPSPYNVASCSGRFPYWKPINWHRCSRRLCTTCSRRWAAVNTSSNRWTWITWNSPKRKESGIAAVDDRFCFLFNFDFYSFSIFYKKLVQKYSHFHSRYKLDTYRSKMTQWR